MNEIKNDKFILLPHEYVHITGNDGMLNETVLLKRILKCLERIELELKKLAGTSHAD